MPVFGYALVHDDGPAKADMAVVLAGDRYGERLLKAGELAKNGFVPSVLVSSPDGPYGTHEGDLAIQFAVQHGLQAEWFVVLNNNSKSTKEESVVLLAELRRRNVKNFILVTSDYHSGRARRTFRSAIRASGGGLEFRTIPAPDHDFLPAHWWHSRESLKTFFLEWCKTIETAIAE